MSVDPCKSITVDWNEGEFRQQVNEAYNQIPKGLNIVLNQLREYLFVVVSGVDIGIREFENGLNVSLIGINQFGQILQTILEMFNKVLGGSIINLLQLIFVLVFQNLIPETDPQKMEKLRTMAMTAMAILFVMAVAPIFFLVYQVVSFVFYLIHWR